MHRLQKTILYLLITNPQLRYAKLKPAEVEGNLFMYHLKKLIKLGYVAKTPDGFYQLTQAGKSYADQLSLTSFTPRVQPRIVTLIAVQNQLGMWLVFRRKRQPLIGQAGFVYGKIHLGEKVVNAAARELKEKAGLSADLRHCGDGYITIREGDEAVSEVFFHMFYGSSPLGELQKTSKHGTAFWADRSEFVRDGFMASMPDLLGLIEMQSPERFFVELEYENTPQP